MLAGRLRAPGIEVDLVAEDGGTLVCVEVKTGRAGPRYRPGARLDARTLGRLRAAARALARRRGCSRARVDLVEVLLEPRGPRLVHHRDLARPLDHGPPAGTPAPSAAPPGDLGPPRFTPSRASDR